METTTPTPQFKETQQPLFNDPRRYFAFHKLNEQGIANGQEIAARFTALLAFLDTVCIDGRELALARTKLEEASFFAKKAMATNLANQAD